MNEIGILLIVAVVGIIILAGYFAAKAQEQRRKDLMAFAASNGFQAYVAQGSGCLTMGVGGGDWPGTRLIEVFESFQPFGTGLRPRAFNAVLGSKGDRSYYFFDYQYETESTSTDSEGRTQTDRTTHSFGVVAVRVPLNMQPLSIRPEGFFDKIKGALGFRDIQFEMDEFNRRFMVAGPDEKFAFDLIHPRRWSICSESKAVIGRSPDRISSFTKVAAIRSGSMRRSWRTLMVS